MGNVKLNFEDWENILTLVGTVVGAGILGLPYVFENLGYINGLFLMGFFTVLILLVNLELVQVILRTKTKKELIGLADKYLGRKGELLTSFSFFLSQSGALVAYILGTHVVLYSLTGKTIITFIAIGLMNLALLLKLKYFNDVETFLSLLIILIITALSFYIIPENNITYLKNGLKDFQGLGVILFSLNGISIIPELVWNTNPKKKVPKMMTISYLMIFSIYLLFTTVFLAVYGPGIKEVATTNLPASLGLMGGSLTLVLLLSSYLSLSRGLIKTFEFDLKLSKLKSYFLTIISPPLLILLGFDDFISVLNIIGLLTGGLLFIIVILSYEKTKQKRDKRSVLKMDLPTPLNKILILLIFLIIIAEVVF